MKQKNDHAYRQAGFIPLLLLAIVGVAALTVLANISTAKNLIESGSDVQGVLIARDGSQDELTDTASLEKDTVQSQDDDKKIEQNFNQLIDQKLGNIAKKIDPRKLPKKVKESTREGSRSGSKKLVETDHQNNPPTTRRIGKLFGLFNINLDENEGSVSGQVPNSVQSFWFKLLAPFIK